MSYHCERCGTHLDDLATQCGCDLSPTKAEIDRARIGHATPIMDAVIAERDRLAAENAELRKSQATLNISAVYWPKDGTAELTWEDTESGKRCEMTVLVTKKQGERLSEVVWPCVYYGARTEAANATLARITAENAELKAEYAQLVIDYEQILDGLTESDATLDRLREVAPEVLPPHMSWRDALDGARAILYPKETDNGN